MDMRTPSASARASPSIPEGSTKFGALAFLQVGRSTPSVPARTFFSTAHTMPSEGIAGALLDIAKKDINGARAQAHALMGGPDRILLNSPVCISSQPELSEASKAYVEGRNALIAYLALTLPSSNFLETPYQKLCARLIEPLGVVPVPLKAAYMNILGTEGNLLPPEEKEKLGRFMAAYLRYEQNVQLKAGAARALTNLLFADAVQPIAAAPAGVFLQNFEDFCYRSALILCELSGRSPVQLLVQFLYGEYSAPTKLNAGLFLRSMKMSDTDSYVARFMEMVDESVLQFKAASQLYGADPAAASKVLSEELLRMVSEGMLSRLMFADVEARNGLFTLSRAAEPGAKAGY